MNKHKADLADRIQKGILYFIRINLLIVIITSLIESRWTLVFTGSLIFFLTYIPSLFEKKYRIYLPLELELIIVIFLYASLFLGEFHGYYTKFWWWDIVLHTGSGIVLGFAGFLILYILYNQDKIKASALWIAIFSFCFALAIGGVWEIFEFSMDSFFGSHMQKSGLVDTMWDLIVDAIGAFLTSWVGYFYLKSQKNRHGLFNRIIVKFVEENPRLFKEKQKLSQIKKL